MKLKTDNNNILYCWKSQLCQTLLLQWRKISIGFNPFTGPTKPTKEYLYCYKGIVWENHSGLIISINHLPIS